MGLTAFWKAGSASDRSSRHQDSAVQDPRSYIDAHMIFLMYYLEDTSRHNGCRSLSRFLVARHLQQVCIRFPECGDVSSSSMDRDRATGSSR